MIPAMLLLPREGSPNYALYQYTPSLAPAIAAATLFFLGAVVHIRAATQLRCRAFVPFIIGCLMEAVGYGGRIWSHYDDTGIGGYIIQAILILIAPALFAASIYMILGQIIALVNGERYSPIRLRWLTKVFVIGDCLSFLTQTSGGGIQAGGTLSLLKLGEKIIVVGLFMQILFFCIFLGCATYFHIQIRAKPTQRAQEVNCNWQQHMVILYLTSGIILVRSVFRVIEYLMGNDGYILQHEFMLYIFDTILMLSVVGIFLCRHPGTIIKSGLGVQASSPVETEDVELLGQLKN